MLRGLFPRSHRSYQQSPWAEELREFGGWLRATGYSRDSTCGHLFRLKRALERMVDLRPGATFTVVQLSSAFCSGSSSQAALYRATQRAYQRFLAASARLTIPPTCDRFEAFRLSYRQHLAALRGFAATTIQQHDRTMGDFLSRSLDPHRALADLTPADVERYLLLKSPAVTRQTLQHTVAHLRSFLRYGYERGDIRSRLDTMIDTPRTYRGELPPRAPDWRLVQELLGSIDRSGRAGWRDYAILHLMAHYGLRPSEIVTLRLDSMDWSAGVLHVEQRKTRSPLVLPLVAETLSMLRLYLCRGRPTTRHPELFLRARSPEGALQPSTVTTIFEKRARLSGLALGGYSAYCLRHAFAMRLLTRGVGVKAIGDLLGHRSLESTCQYLRLDVDMLREVALPVPTVEPTGGL
ncbi:MAG: tyrosine-type recombinase/integrase [Pseudomonadota bacterium]